LEAASDADPHWGAPRLELAWAKLDSGDAQGASEAIRELGWYDPQMVRRHDLRTRVDLGDPVTRPWRGRLAKAMASDVRLSLQKEGTLGVLDWYQGNGDGLTALSGAIAGGDADLKLQAALAQAAMRNGSWQMSLEVTDRVLGSRRRAGLFHGIRGRAAEALQRGGESAAAFDLALKYSGDHPSVLLWAYSSRIASGDIAGSKVVFEAMEALGEDGPIVLDKDLAQASPKE
jgi:hypothetical protein